MALVLTDIGIGLLTNRINGAGTAIVYIGWGTGAGTARTTDTTLFTEAAGGGYARALGVASRVTTSIAFDTYRVVGSLTAGSLITVTNWGLFDALTNGNMMIKEDFAAAYVIQATGTLSFQISLQLKRL